jgi:hypothetical protein
VAFASNLEATALDDALDLLDILITEMFSEAARASDKSRLRTIKGLDTAAVQLMQVCRLVLDSGLHDADCSTSTQPWSYSQVKAIPSSLKMWPGCHLWFSSISICWAALPFWFRIPLCGDSFDPFATPLTLFRGCSLTPAGHWICTTRVTLTRFSVPLIPNTLPSATRPATLAK